MPAVSAEYDYYGYARARQGAVKKAAPVSRSQSVPSTTRRPTSEATKMATRNALSDDFIGVTSTKKKQHTVKTTSVKTEERKVSTKKKDTGLDPVVFQKKAVAKKPEELKLKKMQVAKKKKAQEIARQKERALALIKNILLSAALFAMFFFICYRYTLINEAFNDVSGVKSQLKEKETINAQIESNIKQNTDLSYIENYAKYQLGMQKPKFSQIQKIVIEIEDKITTPIEIKEEVKEDKVSKVFQNLLKVLD